MKLSDWIVIDGYCATRVKSGTDPMDVENRIAFIEKTPSIRLPHSSTAVSTKGKLGATGLKNDQSVWVQGYSSDDSVDSSIFRRNLRECSIQSMNLQTTTDLGEYGLCPKSRTWCDEMLKLLGYEI